MSGATYYKDFDYKSLQFIRSYKKRGFSNRSYNPCFIMADTETSKKDNPYTKDNHICAFSIAIRFFNKNIACLYGHDPVEFMDCLQLLKDNLKGELMYVYFHNMTYDYQFCRQFLYQAFGNPVRQLNTKSHYPIYIEFNNGLILRDSLILAQRSLEKWSKDLNVEHQKALGAWNYDLIRNQDHQFDDNELLYISNDVLAGVECLDATAKILHKNISSMPWTATGIPREELYKISQKHNAHENFLRTAPDFEQQQILQYLFHGGYTHGNRYLYQILITDIVECYDFSSSYPYCMLSERFPCSKFYDTANKTIEEILSLADKYAFMFKLILIKPDLKDYHATVMPVLQLSKCEKVVNPVIDNGRILCADYVEIWITEQDLIVINEQYKYLKHLCICVQYAHKDYLPRFITDYVYSLYVDKCKLKGVDPILYQIQKAKLNSCYGMTVQRPISDDIKEDYETGDFYIEGRQNEEEYEKYLKRRKSFLNYSIGVWVTSYAQKNLFELGKCIDYEKGGYWIYSDTDSIYAHNWNKDKLREYNDNCIRKLSLNGYEGVRVGDKIFHLGIAEHDGTYKEFKYTGAKRYCKRDMSGKLSITVAGVPKQGVISLNDDINNFKSGFCFDGITSGKLQHEYIYHNFIYTDEKGNITGDCIDLTPCDYILDSETPFDIYDTIPGFYEDD